MDPLRKNVLDLLLGGQAHATLTQALDGLPPELAGKKPRAAAHTVWELLEHIRIAQWDILEFTRDPGHVSPPWPQGYWPPAKKPANPAALAQSLAAIQADAKAFAALVKKRDLLAPLPHDRNKTLLRQALLLADHNAYHVGQLVELRKMLGAWAG